MARLEAEFAEDVFEVHTSGALGDHQYFGHVAVGESACYQPSDLLFSRGEG